LGKNVDAIAGKRGHALTKISTKSGANHQRDEDTTYLDSQQGLIEIWEGTISMQGRGG